jgi:putative ABC transport system permease protein
MRTLLKYPAFTAVALVTSALGIGANTAIFSIMYSVLFTPLPFGQPDRLVQIWESRLDRGWDRASFTHANFWDLRDLNSTFEDLGTLKHTSFNLTGFDYPERLRGGRISAGFFRILRVAPTLGRTFLPGEDQPGEENRVALLGNEIWRSRFAADPEIIGTPLRLDGESFTVVGVLPPGEPWLDSADVFVPLVQTTDADRVSFELAAIGRLAPGASMESARSDLEAVCGRLAEMYPNTNAGMGISMAPASDWIAGDNLRRALWILMGAVGFLLMIACVNLINLLLAKATGRMRELAVRAVLGAGRGRIARQVLTESLVLGVIGGSLGLLLAVWGIDAFKAMDPGGIPRIAEIGINKWVLAFTLLTALVTGAVSGSFPAFQMPRSDFISALRDGGRSVAGSPAQKRIRSSLVAAEVALSLVLLIGAGLLIRSFNELLRVERGFQVENRLFVAVNLPSSDNEDARTRELLSQFLLRARSLPQVQSAAAVSGRPLVAGSTGMGIGAADQTEDPGGNVPWASWRLITDGYFRTMGIPLLKGRSFDERDEIGKPWRAIISQRLAELLWPGEDPIGRQAVLWKGQSGNVAEIVGVVGNMRERSLASDPTLAVYLPYYGAGWSPVNFVLHTEGDSMAIVPALRSLLVEINPNLPLSNIRSMDQILSSSVASSRLNTLLLTIFAGVALVLALAGIYGVLAYSVARRTSEIGVRVAMGASPSGVLRMIMSQGMVPVLFGILSGIIGALALSRFLSSMLFGIMPSDPLTYVAVALLLVATALLSCYLPALRALTINPVTALRNE